ncbi:MAG: hypothetical protein C0415_01760 [Thermodesulfovibrio sp.]|nr:hypothetical protein [Thermodesulfovibrio sp.]
MSRYWVIAPYDSTKLQIWENVWKYDLTNGVISIGWNELGNISNLNEKELKELIKSTYPKSSLGINTFSFNVLWNFYHNISIGDIVIARKGTKKIAGIGKVIKTAFYSKEDGEESVNNLTDYYYPNFIGVEWNQQIKDIQFNEIIFSFQTMYEINENKYNSLLQGKSPQEEDELEETVEKKEFFMEKYLEEFIISNFDTIFDKKLRLYKDPEGNIARQYPTDIGVIDILAEEVKTKDLIVIELKKGRESDKVVGQILRYMGWIDEYLRKENQKVKGIIICKEPDQKLLYAIKKTIDIQIKYYGIDFKLMDNWSTTSNSG